MTKPKQPKQPDIMIPKSAPPAVHLVMKHARGLEPKEKMARLTAFNNALGKICPRRTAREQAGRERGR